MAVIALSPLNQVQELGLCHLVSHQLDIWLSLAVAPVVPLAETTDLVEAEQAVY
jgi:hypothetical protein